MTTNRKQLLCPFFPKISKKVLGDFFQQRGFQTHETRVGGLFFQKGDVFVEVRYDPETYPSYSPTLIIGIGKDKFDKSGAPAGVPVWYLLPDDSDVRRYSFWRFKSEQDLEKIMDKILNQIVKLYLEPLWENVALLKSKVSNFKASIGILNDH